MPDLLSHALLTCQQMGQADAWAVAHGVPGAVLMERAGAAVAAAIEQRWAPRRTLVLCGPGQNGGDGYVVARLLAQRGWPVQVAALCPIDQLRGDALHHARLWQESCSSGSEPGDGERQAVQPLAVDARVLAGVELVVDALFGAGLNRDLSLDLRLLLAQVQSAEIPLVAVDVPSGLLGDTGQSLGAVASTLTVTFWRKKLGHVLMPGRSLCGELVVADIGIADQALDVFDALPLVQENHPGLWRWAWAGPQATGHKYHRGHALVLGGCRMVGAARLCARAAARAGAGLVTLLVPQRVWPVYVANLLSGMAQPLADASVAKLLAAWEYELGHLHWRAMAMGPGAALALPGGDDALRQMVLVALAEPLSRPVVLDADALTAFEQVPDVLFDAIREAGGSVVLTPHEGEFTRLFGGPVAGCLDKVGRARWAAKQSGAVVLFKGADTVIAAPDGRVVVNTLAPPWLATGGSGDVLGGIIVGLLAQGLPAMEAACAGAWLHGACAQAFGPGLLAEDLPEQLPKVLRQFWA